MTPSEGKRVRRQKGPATNKKAERDAEAERETKAEQDTEAVSKPVLDLESPDKTFYESLFHSSPANLAVWQVLRDRRGKPKDLRFVDATDAFAKTFGLSDFVGHTVSELLPGLRGGKPDVLELCARVVETGTLETSEAYQPDTEGWLQLRVHRFSRDLVVALVFDATESKLRTEALVRTRYVMDNIRDYPIWTNAEGRVVEVSETTCRALEYTREELLEMRVFDISPTLTPDFWRERWDLLRKVGFSTIETTHLTKTGRLLPVELSTTFIVYEGDEYHCAFCRDISDRKRTETDLRRLRYSLDRMDDYPTWNDPEGRIIEVSESTCRHLEYTREELLGMTVFDICPEIDRRAWAQSWEQNKTLDTLRVETHHKTKSGRMFPVEVTVNPMTFDGHEYHCTFCRDLSEQRRLEESLLLTQLSVENAPDMIHWIESDGHIIYANRSMCEFLGYSLEELQQMYVWDLSPTVTPELLNDRWKRAAEHSVFLPEEVWKTKDGLNVAVEVSTINVIQEDRELGLAFVRDVTQRNKATRELRESEEQLRTLYDAQSETLRTLKERDEQLLQAQKMEAIGRLAGGMAHDFNNVLTTIIGYSDLLLSSPECPPGPVAEDIAEIKEAAQRAGSLTQRILAFSRRQTMEPTVMSLNSIVSETERLLARTIGADIELRTSLSPDLEQVEIDEQQFVQVLLNLAVNARDAMPDGGTLTIETYNADPDERFCETHPETHPGPYVVLTVTDTGVGMEDEVLNHVFEPFYTTKPPGMGTGLGLATVYGIVTQSGGCIYADSSPGRGTTVQIYLPRASDAPPRSDKDSTEAAAASAHTVIIADSDTAFRSLATRILERRGFTVMPFIDGEGARRALGDPGLRVDVLITDTSLSGGIQGARLAELATKERPGLPVLFLDTEPPEDPDGSDLVAYLEKPFTAEELTSRVRTWLT